MTSGFLNPSQSDFVIFKQNPIKLWNTARSHSGFWAGSSIVCPFSRSRCVSCCECLNLPAILPISDGKNWKHIETSTARDWAYGCASFYSWLTGKRLLAYIDCRNKGPIVPCLMVWIFVCIPSGGGGSPAAWVCQESHVRWPGDSGFCYRASEFCVGQVKILRELKLQNCNQPFHKKDFSG